MSEQIGERLENTETSYTPRRTRVQEEIQTAKARNSDEANQRAATMQYVLDIPGITQERYKVILAQAEEENESNPGSYNDIIIRLADEYKETIEQFSVEDVVVYTSTFYKDTPEGKVRSQLALETLDNAEKLGLSMVVIDGGSDDFFLQAYQQRNYQHIEIISPEQEKMGMGAERRQALRYTLETFPNTPYILRMEPEKSALLQPENLLPLIQKVRAGENDIVVPKRIDKSTLPDFQAREETRANKELSALMMNTPRKKGKQAGKAFLYEGEAYDFFFGPKLFTKEGAEYFLNSDSPDRGGIIVPVIQAGLDGKSIGSTETAYTYDISQKEHEEGDHEQERRRLFQYIHILKQAKKTKGIIEQKNKEIAANLGDSQ